MATRYSQRVVGHSRLAELQRQAAQISVYKGFSVALLEREYARWLRMESAPMRRWLMSVPFFAMVLAPIYGTLLLDTSADHVIWLRLIEFGVAAPLCALSVHLLYRRPSMAQTTRVMLIAAIVVFWAVALIRWLGAKAGSSLSPEIVMIVPLAVAAVARLRLFMILPMIGGCSTLFLVAEWFVNGGAGFAATVLGTLLFSAMSVITALASDRLTRQAWLAREIVELTAMSDAVTGLPNRQWLNRDMAVLFSLAQRNREPLAVYLIDLDYFKKLNDTHGHAAGDDALRAVGEMLARFGRRPLDLAGRFGGEEFVLILHDAKPHGAVRIAQELVSYVAGLGIENAGSPLKVLTASVGIYAAIPSPSERPEDFLHRADVALYEAKHGGRNRFRFHTPPMDSATEAEHAHDAMETPIPIT